MVFMTRNELFKYIKPFTFRARVTELHLFLAIEVSNKKYADVIDAVIRDKKQCGIIHKVTHLKWWQCWFPRYQFVSLNKLT